MWSLAGTRALHSVRDALSYNGQPLGKAFLYSKTVFLLWSLFSGSYGFNGGGSGLK